MGAVRSARTPSYQGVQRYICKSCKRSFTSRDERFSKAVEAQAIDMYLNNVGVRKVARFTGASPAAVLKWISKASQQLVERLERAAVQVQHGEPDVIEMDEIYTYVQKKIAGQLYGLLIVGNSVALLRTILATRACPAP